MLIKLDVEDCKLLENKSKDMIESYIRYNLKMFKINKIEIEDKKSRENGTETLKEI